MAIDSLIERALENQLTLILKFQERLINPERRVSEPSDQLVSSGLTEDECDCVNRLLANKYEELIVMTLTQDVLDRVISSVRLRNEYAKLVELFAQLESKQIATEQKLGEALALVDVQTAKGTELASKLAEVQAEFELTKQARAEAEAQLEAIAQADAAEKAELEPVAVPVEPTPEVPVEPTPTPEVLAEV